MTREEQVMREKPVTVYLDPTCDRCQAPMAQVFDHPGADEYRQWHNALRVRLDGGYGMYYDLTEHDLVLCKECADGLVAYLGVDTIDSESA